MSSIPAVAAAQRVARAPRGHLIPDALQRARARHLVLVEVLSMTVSVIVVVPAVRMMLSYALNQ